MGSWASETYYDSPAAWKGCVAVVGNGSRWSRCFSRFACNRAYPRFSKPSLPFNSSFSLLRLRGSEAHWEKEGAGMNPFWEVADFVRGVRRGLRFGEISRAPLRLLRLELRGESLACDWVARPADIWDADLRQPLRDRNESMQALADAVALRDLAFDALPNLQTAVLRAFRSSGALEPPELVINGVATRGASAVFPVPSLAIRAKFYRFPFEIEDGILPTLRGKE